MHVFLLGAFRLTTRSRSIEQTGWRLGRAGTLAKLLVLAPEHRIQRERVTDRLWPDLDPAAIELYAGDLLPGDHYEGWTELRQAYLTLLSRII